MPNKIDFPVNLYLAKAYAAGIITINCKQMIEPVTMMEFLAYIRKGPAFIASTKLIHCGDAGIKVGGNVIVSRKVWSEVEIIHRNGKTNIIKTAAFNKNSNADLIVLNS
jgi:hypothetical protein